MEQSFYVSGFPGAWTSGLDERLTQPRTVLAAPIARTWNRRLPVVSFEGRFAPPGNFDRWAHLPPYEGLLTRAEGRAKHLSASVVSSQSGELPNTICEFARGPDVREAVPARYEVKAW